MESGRPVHVSFVDRSGSVATAAAPAVVESLYREHGARVLAVCRGLLRDRGEAEDAAQQVFVSALCALTRGTEPRDPEAWLVTIARRECWARGRNRMIVDGGEERVQAAGEDTLAAVIRREELGATWSAIAGLPSAQRQAFLLREVRGLHYGELAAGLRLSEPSVRSLLNRARRTLRMSLERTAAALNGVSWLSALARLLADGTNSTVSAAGRTAAVGLGALALGSGTLAVDRLMPHAHSAAKQPASAAGRARRPAAPSHVVIARSLEPSRPHPAALSAALAQESDQRRESRRGADATRRGDDGGGGDSSRHGSAGGDGTSGSATSGPGPGSGSASGGPGPSGGSSSSGEGSGTAGDSGLDGSSLSGDDGSGSSAGSGSSSSSGELALVGSSSGSDGSSSSDGGGGGDSTSTSSSGSSSDGGSGSDGGSYGGSSSVSSSGGGGG
jgi:RNA polymerase sigma factor (sigma-70 family)